MGDEGGCMGGGRPWRRGGCHIDRCCHRKESTTKREVKGAAPERHHMNTGNTRKTQTAYDIYSHVAREYIQGT